MKFPELLLTLLNGDNQDDIAQIFCNQLMLDYQIVEYSEEPSKDTTSDYCFFSPSTKIKEKLLNSLSRKICFKIFPVLLNIDEEKNKIQRVHSYIRYNKLIKQIKKYKKAIELNNTRSSKLKISKKIYEPRNFCTLKNNKELSFNVLNPLPMPVEVAPLEDLEPFFEFLKSSQPITDEQIEFKRGIFYNDGRMDLCKQVVADKHIEKLMDSIKNNMYIKHFLLGNNIISLEGATAIANYLKEYPYTIETWYLAGNRIDASGIKLICKELSSSTVTKSLWLKRNPLFDEGAYYISLMLNHNKSIEVLDLHNTGIGDKGAKFIFESLKHNNTLRHLYLGACGLEEITYIIEYFDFLVHNKIHGLEHIYLDMNRLGNYWADRLVNVVNKYEFMKGFTISSNRLTDCSYILDTLAENKSIINLDLGFYKATLDMGELPNNFGIEDREKNILAISNFLFTNDTVKVFSIMNTGLTAEDIDKISCYLHNNESIIMFNYEQYNEKSYPRTLKTINDIIKRNSKGENIRELKHGNLIRFIDSNYRNNM